MLRLIKAQDPIVGLDACLQELADFSRKEIGKRAFLLVPEEAKADTERRYMELFDKRGLMMAEVLSFRRFAHRIFSEAGLQDRRRIGDQGKALLLTSILQEKKDELPFLSRLAGKAGYAAELSQILGDFQRYRVGAEDLLLAAKADIPVLSSEKIEDLARLQVEFIRRKEELEIYDSDEDLTRLRELLERKDRIPRLGFLKEARIWVAGFGLLRAFTPQELSLLKVLSACVDELTVTLSPWLSEDREEKTHFAGRSLEALKIYCGEVRELVCENAEREGIEPVIELWQAESGREEIAACAGEIKYLLATKAYRRRDIAVALCQEEDLDLLSATFQEFGLDPFIAQARPLEESPLIRFLEFFLRLTRPEARISDLLSLAKTGLLDIDELSLDLWENFLLQTPAKYVRQIEPDKTNSYFSAGQPAYDFYNQYLRKSFLAARALAEQKGGKAKALFLLRFLNEEEGIRGRLEKLARDLHESGLSERALLIANSWETVLSLLEEAAGLLGEADLSNEDFAELILGSLLGARPQGIPLGLDRIRVGCPEQLLLYPAKVLFILGATVKSFPPGAPDEGLLQNRERESIEEYGRVSLPNYRRDSLYSGMALEHYLLMRGEDRLYLSAPSLDKDDLSLLQQELAGEGRYAQKQFAAASYPDKRWLAPERARRYLSLGEAKKEPWQGVWREVLTPWEREEALDVLNELRPRIFLPEDLAWESLRDTRQFSISRLQTFNDCPYQYFASYLLKLRDRPVYEPRPDKRGTFLHSLMEKAFMDLVKEVRTAGDEEERLALVKQWGEKINPRYSKEVYEEVAKDKDFAVYREPAILGSQGLRFMKTLTETLAFNQRDMLESGYLPYQLEWKFPEEGNDRILCLKHAGQKFPLRGLVDRIDRHEDGSFRLFDYKSNRHDLRAEAMLTGSELQLPLYAYALKTAHPNIEIREIAWQGLYMDERKTYEDRKKKEKAEQEKDKPTERMRAYRQGEKDLITRLSRYSLKYGERIIGEMASGNISPRPLTTDEQTYPCRYCDYQNICRFDERLQEARSRLVKLDKKKGLEGYLEIFEAEGRFADEEAALQEKLLPDKLKKEKE